MKNKMRFILPRLIGWTLIVGLATWIIGVLFKLLLLFTFAAAIGTWAAARIRRRKAQHLQEGANPFVHQAVYRRSAINPVVPVPVKSVNSNLSIIPIH
ncbi:hypothetical protein [Sphingobacterium suaedae]|uniref:DUF4133 domain-containing protein n=1 Tax=Sphingobacterium suaedae TaxID=1686402 RepID=A0ABW5KDK4_9SPHI